MSAVHMDVSGSIAKRREEERNESTRAHNAGIWAKEPQKDESPFSRKALQEAKEKTLATKQKCEHTARVADRDVTVFLRLAVCFDISNSSLNERSCVRAIH